MNKTKNIRNIEILSTLDYLPYSFLSIRKFIENTIDNIGIKNWNMGVLLTDNKEIQNYNRRWRNIDAPTDVLSFVQDEGEPIPFPEEIPHEKGDIVVSMEKVAENAKRLNRPLEEELRRVIIHAILHLMGMEHPGDDYEGEMLKIQEKLVSETQSLR